MRRDATMRTMGSIDIENLVPEDALDVSDVPKQLLSEVEIEITEDFTPIQLVEAMRERRYTAVQVISAFIKRASIAHKLVSDTNRKGDFRQ